MKNVIIGAAAVLAVAVATAPAQAGCLSGAVGGGVAGHMVGHGKLGAAAGCVIGHERSKSKQNANTTGSVDQRPANNGKNGTNSGPHQ